MTLGDAMFALDEAAAAYAANPSDVGAREIGRCFAVRRYTPPSYGQWAWPYSPPVEPEHMPAYLAGCSIEDLRRVAARTIDRSPITGRHH